MSGDFLALKQASLPIVTGSNASIAIPLKSDLPGFPSGKEMVVKIVTDQKAVYKIGSSADSADKTVTGNFLSIGNLYAYKNAIETYKVVPINATSTPTHIHAIADTLDGTIDLAFGYYY